MDVAVAHSCSRSSGTIGKDAPTNPRGIPYAPFVDKVEDYVSSLAEVEGTMRSFQEMISYVSHPLATGLHPFRIVRLTLRLQ